MNFLTPPAEPVTRLAFTHPKLHGALSLAWDAGIENVHAWSKRFWIDGEWTLVFDLKTEEKQ